MAITTTMRTQVAQLYVSLFGRAPEADGLGYWVSQLDAGKTAVQVAQSMYDVPAARVLYPAFLTNQEIVAKFYTNVLGRTADTDGLAYWTAQLNTKTKGQVISDLITAVTAYAGTDAAALTSQNLFNNKVTVGLYYAVTTGGNNAANTVLASVTDAAASVTTAQAAIDNAAAVGQTISLTTSIDTVQGTSGNDTINAALVAGANSLTSLDNIDGGAGTDTLNIITLGDLSTAVGATVANVEVVNLTSAAAITAANISGWTGVTTMNVVSPLAISGVKASATTDINVVGAIAGVGVDGGKNVIVTNSTAGNIIVGATTAAAGTVTATNSFATGTIAVKGAGALTATANDGSITFTNGSSVTATASKAVALATRVADTAAAAAALLVSNTAGSAGTAFTADSTAGTKVTNLTTFAANYSAANVNSDTVAESKALTLVEQAAGRITLADKVAIDAAYVAAFTAVGGTATLAQAAALALITPIKAAATAAKVVTAATLVSAAAATTAADAVVTADTAAAALVDGVVVTATTNTALTSATINGNYGTTTNAVTDGSTSHNTLTSATLNNAGGTTITGLAVANVSATGMVADVTTVNTTVGHAINYTLSGVTAGTYTDINATTVNITSNGTAANVLTGLSSTLATAINVSGTAGVTFGTLTAAAAAVIDASANSGTNTITTLATQTYTGGSGIDNVTSNNGVAQAKAIDGGAGVADKLIIGNATDFGTTAAAALFKNFETLQTTVAVDVSKFTGSAISKVILSGTIAVTGLNAAQSGNLVINATSTPTIGVTGAATPGQLDTVSIEVNDASATVNTIAITTPVLAGVETLNLTATDNFTISALTSAPALTKVTVSGAGTSSIITGALALAANTVFDASAATGAVTIDASAATGNGISITGSATKANTLTSNALGSVLTGGAAADTITGGAGNDTINAGEGNNTVAGGGGADVITAGNGNNTISGFVGGTVTVGNGYNTITGGAGDDTIVVGTGGNVITSGAGLDKITLGAHVLGTTDTLVVAASAIAVGNVDTVTGFVSGTDTIQLTAGVNTTFAALTLAAGNTAATMLAAVTDATSVASLADVYTALATATGLDNSAGHAFAASAAGAGTLVAREVVYTTGAAAGTYLVINDSTAGFQAANDIVIKLVGNTTFIAADLSVA